MFPFLLHFKYLISKNVIQFVLVIILLINEVLLSTQRPLTFQWCFRPRFCIAVRNFPWCGRKSLLSFPDSKHYETTITKNEIAPSCRCTRAIRSKRTKQEKKRGRPRLHQWPIYRGGNHAAAQSHSPPKTGQGARRRPLATAPPTAATLHKLKLRARRQQSKCRPKFFQFPFFFFKHEFSFFFAV